MTVSNLESFSDASFLKLSIARAGVDKLKKSENSDENSVTFSLSISVFRSFSVDNRQYLPWLVFLVLRIK